ncbi:hypothetical protein BH23PAT1_BH23PAT1_2380 [soil metagenome]
MIECDGSLSSRYARLNKFNEIDMEDLYKFITARMEYKTATR